MYHPWLGSGLSAGLLLLIIALVVWSFVWKGIALWKAARNSDKAWFIALLLLNTFGILEIVYIYFFAEKNKQSEHHHRHHQQ